MSGEKPDPLSRQDVEGLIEVIEQIASGRYNNDIMEFTRPEVPAETRRIAEAVGMMMVKVEAREAHLEQLVEQLRELNDLLKTNILETVMAMASALGTRDEYTAGHAQRVAGYAERLARRLELSEQDVEDIRTGGMLHDIGKIGFSDRIFSNEDMSISDELLAEIRRHPEFGVNILKGLTFLGPVLEYVHAHHERLDGKGYPRGLAGEQIPLGARIICVADCFDAMTTNRPYQKAKTPDEAFAILRKMAGSACDPKLVEALAAEIDENGMAEA